MKPKKKILLGCSDFKEMIETNSYYVDKSLFIKNIIDNSNKVMLIPRPRRFGKTLNLSMLRYFFDIREPENKQLFTELAIWQCEEQIKAEQGKYPVMYISFKNAKGNTWEDCYDLIKIEIIDLFQKHIYLLESEILYEHEITYYNKILAGTASLAIYKNSLRFLTNYLYRYHNQKVIVLMDEYDAPIQSAYEDYYDDAVDFMRGLMSGAFKDNSNLYKGVITGILRVSRESIFSDLNNIGVFSIMQNKFSDNFGFSEKEIRDFFTYFDISVPFEEVRTWYDGYQFGDLSGIYNPWSAIKFVSNYQEERKLEFKPFWVNTSSNNLIKNLIRAKTNNSIRSEILKLLNGEPVEQNIEENFVFPDLKQKKHFIWTLFLFSGYLTIKKKVAHKSYILAIPNYELKIIFKDIILDWFDVDLKVGIKRLQNMANSLVNNDLKTFEKAFKEIMGDTFSYYDTAKNNEYVFHAYILGLLAILGDDYILKSNRESGDGRYDIMLIPKQIKDNKGVVIEIKRTEKQQPKETDDDFQTRINNKIEEAKNQINKNKYYKELIDSGISDENIIKTAIVFAGKEPFFDN